MSTAPQPRQEGRPLEAERILDASRAARREAELDCHRRDERLRHLLADGCLRLDLPRHGAAMEALFRIYYQCGGEPQVLGVELSELDGQPPAPGRRVRLEEELSEQLAGFGEAWNDFLSRIEGCDGFAG